jgi:hypothetical protein
MPWFSTGTEHVSVRAAIVMKFLLPSRGLPAYGCIVRNWRLPHGS